MLTLSQIAEITEGALFGDKHVIIRNIKSPESADSSSLSFYIDPRKLPQLADCKAGVVLIREEHEALFSGNKILVKDPYLAYAKVSQRFRLARPGDASIHSSVIVAPDAVIEDGVSIGAYSVIGKAVHLGKGVSIGSHVCIGEDVKVGQGTVVEDNVVIYSRSVIGERCYFSSGSVVGSSGFGYATTNNKWEKIEHFGAVEIGDEVDIGANTTIDRGTLDNTVIGNGVKLDNQIQIAHNVQIGENTVMAGCVAVAGSTRIGKRCRFGGRVSVLGHLVIPDDVTVYANSLVSNSIKQKGEYASMIPVQKVSTWRKTVANIHRLEKLAKKIKAIGKYIDD